MNTLLHTLPRWLGIAATLLLCSVAGTAWAVIDGVTGPTFNLTAKANYISTADGNSIYTWGYANGNGTMQYPGVTMIVNQGDVVTVNLSNELPVPLTSFRASGRRRRRERRPDDTGSVNDRRRPGMSYLHRDPRRHLPLPQRHPARVASRNGAARRAHRAPRCCQSGL
jgi:hypothetical protein